MLFPILPASPAREALCVRVRLERIKYFRADALAFDRGLTMPGIIRHRPQLPVHLQRRRDRVSVRCPGSGIAGVLALAVHMDVVVLIENLRATLVRAIDVTLVVIVPLVGRGFMALLACGRSGVCAEVPTAISCVALVVDRLLRRHLIRTAMIVCLDVQVRSVELPFRHLTDSRACSVGWVVHRQIGHGRASVPAWPDGSHYVFLP